MPNTLGLTGSDILTVVLVQRREGLWVEWRCQVLRRRTELAEGGSGRQKGGEILFRLARQDRACILRRLQGTHG